MNHSLNSKVIVIVGGTTGLGLSAARALVAEGARVVVVGRNTASAELAQADLGRTAIAMTGDAVDSDTAPAAIARAIEAFGGFHGLYHVAGGSGRSYGDGPIHELTDEGIQRTLDLNLASLIKSNRAAARAFMQRGTPGAVLNMGSVLGMFPAPRFFATHVYAAAKSAITGLTRSCAAYYAPFGIRFNVVEPALVETPMSRRASEDDAIMQYVAARQPLDGGRPGAACNVNGAAVFLLSDAACSITGQVLAVDGGWSVCDGGPASGESA